MPRKDTRASQANEGKRSETFRELIRYGLGQTSVAAILVAASDKGAVAIVVREHPGDEALVGALRARFPRAELRHDGAGAREMVEAVIRFVEDPRGNLTLPLNIRGTDFQRRVWEGVRKIPFGRTTTFLEIARAIGAPRAVRAVGAACSQNPLEFAIPCHRVLRSDGSYSGGSPWGDWRQETIVRREAASLADSLKPPEKPMKREIIRVEPLSTYLERWKAPTSAVTRHGDTIYVSGFPPFDPNTGEVVVAPIERQTELVLEQLKLCVETAGSSLEQVLKCNVYCTSVDKFAVVNEIYARYFPKDPPARIFINVPAWPGPFDIEIDCVAAL
jgi:2-iminobutanoate/2-iminopropanoate deaminase